MDREQGGGGNDTLVPDGGSKRVPPRVATFGSVSITEIAIPSPPWIKQAACLDVPDPEIFYPERGGSTAAAKKPYALGAQRFDERRV